MVQKPKRFPNGRAIVQAVTLETMIDDNYPSSAVVNLICGHCGSMRNEEFRVCYSDPKECEVSYEEQEKSWRESIAQSAICQVCKVKNVAMPVEDYLRQQRELSKEIRALMDKWEQDSEDDGGTKKG